MSSPQAEVLVSIVTHNDEAFISSCLESLSKQTTFVRVKVLDNASSDATCTYVQESSVEFHRSSVNLGYCRGHNLNLLGEKFDYALLLNADVRLERDYVEKALLAFDSAERVGSVGGKLLRMDSSGNKVSGRRGFVLDSTGIYFTPTQRHFDRGSGEEDVGQYEKRQLVFGITGAALLCCRELLEDVRFQDQYLDEDFFAYREDADLAWRSQLLGWKAVYEPTAVGLHNRQVLPSGRAAVDPLINYHSVKNRYLLRIKNMDWAVRLRCFPYLWIRDAGILAYMCLKERSSLRALTDVWKKRPNAVQKRAALLSKRVKPGADIARWFSFRPRAFDL